MSFHESEEVMDMLESPVSQEQAALQELNEEEQSFQRQRHQLTDQRALLDLERAELEQQLVALQLKYAMLDVLFAQLDQREAILASEYEVVRTTGERRVPRRSSRQ